MKHPPAITVLMPAHNAAAYIEDAIRSVLKQCFSDFELIVINDGSTDETARIIESFRDHITIIHQKNMGVAAALNAGLQQARGKYIIRCDADDISYPDRFRMQYDFIRAHPGYVYVGSSVDYADEAGNYIFTYRPPGFTDEEINRFAYTESNFIHASVLYSKKAAIEAGGYNNQACILEDHLFWLNICKKGKSFNIDRPLVKVRLNPGSLTITGKRMGKRYNSIKKKAFITGRLSEAEGKEMSRIFRSKNDERTRQVSYHSLLGRKYLWNNHQPQKAREHLKKALALEPANLKNNGLLLFSCLPESCIRALYRWRRWFK